MAGIFLLIASLELIQDKELMVNLTPSPEDHFQSGSDINNQLLCFPVSSLLNPQDMVWQKMSLLMFLCAHLLESGKMGEDGK